MFLNLPLYFFITPLCVDAKFGARDVVRTRVGTKPHGPQPCPFDHSGTLAVISTSTIESNCFCDIYKFAISFSKSTRISCFSLFESWISGCALKTLSIAQTQRAEMIRPIKTNQPMGGILLNPNYLWL